ncbi:Pancreatic alpha-amylase [Orchesella cincta]|uniref:Alpha-amylase n=1 Tax=Orchesella cincta TaxID=48709 RepID=A0A1D2MUP9_ORCCI|nr:Pancreatic alpha-amylase [Orchesella cincta]
MSNFLKGVITLAVFAVGVTAQWDPNFVSGRHSMVHLFEWRWADIAMECERFLGPNGFGGVQVSPPNENAVITNPSRPWWERYQPVSYKLNTRSGNESEFSDMVRRCNAAGVRIYVDAVINHMTGNSVQGAGTDGSAFDASAKSYPAVPYGSADFNDGTTCPTHSGSIENYQDPIQVRNCQLSGLLDLNQGKDYVRQKITEYLNKLVGLGVAGFRIDASKHMWPADMKAILDKLDNLPVQHGFSANARPFIVQEVIDLGNEAITEPTISNFGEGWGMYPGGNSLAFIDNHDNQRGHGAGGANILTFRDSKLYKMAQAFMLSWPYGLTRVMSSYFWEQNMEGGSDKNDWIGPPNQNGATLPVTILPNGTCGNGWMCEHRWRQIFNMVKFRNVVDGTNATNWWDNTENQIAFSRGNKGFVAINNEDKPLTATVPTGLPAGQYCDVISGNKEGSSCTGKTITVNADGSVNLNIANTEEDPMVAIHADAKL